MKSKQNLEKQIWLFALALTSLKLKTLKTEIQNLQYFLASTFQSVQDFNKEIYVQTLPIGRIGNPCSMDHPKDQRLCLVDWTSRDTPTSRDTFSGAKLLLGTQGFGYLFQTITTLLSTKFSP